MKDGMPTIPLMIYLDAMKAAHDREHVLLDQATKLAADVLRVRLEGMNEFRTQLSHQADTFVTRDMFEAKIQPVLLAKAKLDGVTVVIMLISSGAVALAASVGAWLITRLLSGGH